MKSDSMPKVKAKSDSEDIRIYIDGALHLRLPRDKNIRLQSWIEGHTKTFVIELTIHGNSDVVVYDNRRIWERVLELLDENI